MNMADDSPEYYRMREAREREMAADAATEEIRYVHETLAESYRELAEDAEKRERPH